MSMDYKIETKPSLWEAVVSHGSFSDADQDNFFISANTREEAWHLFKKFWLAEYEEHTWKRPILKLDDKVLGVEVFIPDDWKTRLEHFKRRRLSYESDEVDEYWDNREPNLDTDEGDANVVRIYSVDVIKFKK